MKQRTIKFRAWDLYDQRIVPHEVIVMFNGEMKIGIWDYLETEIVNEHDAIYMQFTGLLDKNGKEIYEGDIVRLEQWSPEIYKIIFDRGAFCMSGTNDHPIYDIKYTEKSEVIGNVWENPELLKS